MSFIPDSYMELVNQFDLLSREKENELAAIIRKFKPGKQKQAARELLANSNLRWVIQLAHFYYGRYGYFCGLSIMDFIGAGNEGLMEAVDRFNPEKFKTRFTTYAFSFIRKYMAELLYSLGNSMHIPRYIIRRSQQYKFFIEESNLSDQDIMDRMGLNESELANVKDAHKNIGTTSLQAPIHSCGDDGDTDVTHMKFLRDDKAPMADEEAIQRERSAIIEQALGELEPIQRDILRERWLKPERTQLSELGEKHGVSGEYIRQLEKKALDQMKWRIRDLISVSEL